MKVRLVILFSLIALLAGCQTAPITKPPDSGLPTPPGGAATKPAADSIEAKLAEGEKEFAAGRYDKAERNYAEIMNRYPDQPRADQAWLMHGRCQLKRGFPQSADRSFGEMIRLFPQSTYLDQALLGQAQARLDVRRYNSALNLLGSVNPAGLPDEERYQTPYLAARARLGLNQPAAGAAELVKAYDLAPPQVRSRMVDLLVETLAKWPEEELLQAAAKYTTAFPAAYILDRLTQLRSQSGDWSKALFYQKELVRRFPDHPLAEQAGGMQALSRLTQKEVVTIGALLPLSGRLESYGRRLSDGVQLAAGALDKESPFRVVFEDTGDDPIVTADALERLVVDNKAIAVIGPLSGALAEAAADRANQLGVPLITLTQRRQAAEAGRWIFRDFITPDRLLEAVAVKAVTDLGLTRLGMMYPASSYGRTIGQRFRELAEGLGATIVRSQAYPPDALDLIEPIMAMGGQNPDKPPRDAPLDYDALFVADGYKEAAQVVTQLAFYDLKPNRLIGTNLWHEQAFINEVGEYVQGALVPTAFFPESDEPAVQAFTARFQAGFGRRPGLFEAIGYDATKLVVDLIDQHGLTSRDDLREALSQVTDYSGATGLTNMSETGEALKKPYVLTIRGNRFVPAPADAEAAARQAEEGLADPADRSEPARQGPKPTAPKQPKPADKPRETTWSAS